MEKKQLIEQLTQYPDKIGEILRTYHQFKRQAEQLEAQLAEKSGWPNDSLSPHKSDDYKEIEQQLAEMKKSIDTTEEAIAVLQAQFEVDRIIARSGLYTG